MMKSIKKPVALAAAGVMLIGGALGASAFFTDKAETVNTANVGTMNVAFKDYSDLDGNYRAWADQDGEWTGTSVLTKNGLQDAKFETAAVDADAPSTGIINPGDTGILQFSITNDQEKSFDAAMEVVVESSVAMTDDADEYTIEGLGTPVKSDDDMKLTYRVMLDTVNGSLETEEDGLEAGTEHFYAYNVDMARTALNKFQNADMKVTAKLYAKQHRNSPEGSFTTTADENTDGYADALEATGDWAMVDSFEVTPATYAGTDSVRTAD